MHRHVHAAPGVPDALDHGLHGGGVAHVRLHRDGRAAGLLDSGHDFVGGIMVVQVVDYHSHSS